MRLEHFETLKPVCPRCKYEHGIVSPLNVANITRKAMENVIEGNLICTARDCRQEYPIIDGIPIIVNKVNNYINENFFNLTVRDDLSPVVESILGDIAGPGTAFNNMRHFISTYAWDHYGDKAPDGEFDPQLESKQPGSAARCLQAGLSMLNDKPQAPALDVGCAVGGTTFELASRVNGLTLGIDLNVPVLRVAQRVLREGRVKFPLKSLGIVYDYHDYELDMNNAEHVDFWACDVLALPFTNETFNVLSALNVFDTVSSPRDFLLAVENHLVKSGAAILSTPYDWSPPTPLQAWVGGHSQRDGDHGDSEQILKSLLASSTPGGRTGKGLGIVGEIAHFPWDVRVHNRRWVRYDVHVLACEKSMA